MKKATGTTAEMTEPGDLRPMAMKLGLILAVATLAVGAAACGDSSVETTTPLPTTS